MTSGGPLPGPRPPRLPPLLRRILPPDLQGDLEEGFRRRVAHRRVPGDGSRRRAGPRLLWSRLWYLWEVAAFLLHRPMLASGGRGPRPGVNDVLAQDVRYALRGMVRRPTFTLVVVLTLGLGIGANTTIFSLVSSVFLRAIPVSEPERVLEVYGGGGLDDTAGGMQGFLPFSYPNIRDLLESTTTLAGGYAYTQWPVSLEIGGDPERTTAAFVSADYFDVLGVRPVQGRAFRPEEDDAPGAGAVAVISDAFWRSRFGGEPGVVGRTFRMNSRSYELIGVLPPGFRGTSTTFPADLWVPISMVVDVPTWGEQMENRGARFFFMGARLAPGRSHADARAELQALWDRLRETYPEQNRSPYVRTVPLPEARVNPNLRALVAGAGAVLMAAVGALLLIACMNVANLLLVRAMARRREMAIRTSVGAGRGRLVSQLLTESAVLFGLGGAVGLVGSVWAQRSLDGLQPPFFFGGSLEVRTDLRVLAFTAGVTAVCAVLFGVIPAFRASRSDLAAQLRDGDRGLGPASGRRLRGALVAGQVALSLVALVGAGLFVRSLREAAEVPLGFEPENLWSLSVDLGAQGYSPAEGAVFYRTALEAIRAAPGVERAAVAELRPLSFGPLRRALREEEDPADPDAGQMIRANSVSTDYVKTLGTRLLRGRDLLPSDDADSPPVALVNERMAELYWPGQDPLGRRFRLLLPPVVMTVVGVVATGKYLNVAEEPQPAFYRPLEQAYSPTASVWVRQRPGATGALEAARRVVRELDPALPVFDVMPAGLLVEQALWNARALSLLLGGFGLVGLLLAAVGVYGVVSSSVRERTREMGLRIALGAGAPQVLRTVLGRVVAVAGVGVVSGLVVAAVLTRPLAPQLYGVSPTDPLTYGATAGLLLGVAVLAAWLPARRATRVDPSEALRVD